MKCQCESNYIIVPGTEADNVPLNLSDVNEIHRSNSFLSILALVSESLIEIPLVLAELWPTKAKSWRVRGAFSLRWMHSFSTVSYIPHLIAVLH